MAALVAEKIFVEPDEEISFLVQRILNSGKEHVIIIVPSSSVLFTSNLSIRILYRTIVKAAKVAVIVTEDSYGAKISQKAGFVVVQKVSQITSDLWDVAKGKLFNAQSLLNNKKDSLLKNIKGEAPIETEKVEEVKVEEEIVRDNTTEVFATTEEKIDSFVDNKSSSYNSDTVLEEVEISKPVIEEKVKEINGIKIYSGSDVASLKQRKNSDKIDKLDNLDMNNINREDISVFSEKRFAGRDVTKLTPSRNGLSKILVFLFGGNKVLRPEDRIDGGVSKKWYKRRSVIIAGAALVIGLIIVYLTLFQFSNVSVRVTLKSESIVAEETVEIDTRGTITSVDLEALMIPGKILETEEISSSTTATATGEGKRGEKATGAVYIFNKQEKDIEIPTGTKITSVRTGEVYEVVNDTKLPAATKASDLSINPSRTDNIRVRAVSFGEEYNIDDSDPDSGFTIEGFSTISSQDIKREGEFTGGTSEDFVSVSEEDLDTVKDEIIKNLETQSIDELKEGVPTGFTLLEETIEFEEVEVISNPEVGEEASENAEGEYIFDVTIVGKATGVMVRDSDLEDVIQATIVGDETEADGVNELSDIGFKDFVENSDGIFITIFAEGEITAGFNQEEVFNEIKGKKLPDAQSIIESIEEVQSVELRYYPSVIPESLQFIPASISRVNFRVD